MSPDPVPPILKECDEVWDLKEQEDLTPLRAEELRVSRERLLALDIRSEQRMVAREEAKEHYRKLKKKKAKAQKHSQLLDSLAQDILLANKNPRHGTARAGESPPGEGSSGEL